MKTKLTLTFTSIFFPFLLIDALWLFTFGSFNVTDIFQNGVFWFLTIMYWIAFLWLPLTAIWNKEFKLN